jgi:hypothetical protein
MSARGVDKDECGIILTVCDWKSVECTSIEHNRRIKDIEVFG